MTNTMLPGTSASATFSAMINGGNLRDRFLFQLADGTEIKGAILCDGLRVAGDIRPGGRVSVTVTGIVASTTARTVEIVTDREQGLAVRVPVQLVQAC